MHYKFTGKERDAESGLDNFGARYYASPTGRWMSPDWAEKPEAVPYSNLASPQTLNLYAYVGNNPLRQADIDGHIYDGANESGGNIDAAYDTNLKEQKVEAQQKQQQNQQGQAQEQGAAGNQPAPDKLPSDVPKPPPGKLPGSTQGDPLVPNDWEPGKGTEDRPTRYNPRFPIPGQSQPNVSWDPDQGHWDYNDGFGNRTRYGPNGGKVDHFNNPIPLTFRLGVQVGLWGMMKSIQFYQWLSTPGPPLPCPVR